MKNLILWLLLSAKSLLCPAQRLIRDEHITNQQERMVFKQWDRNRFTPTSGFLGLNPNYWLTWALHPNYPKTDLRPLGPFGPQTQRLGLVLALRQSEEAYKLHSDTLKQQALTKASAYSGLLSDLDPLWQLYYSSEFSPLLGPEKNGLEILSERERKYLLSSGLYDWYRSERESLSQRLGIARRTTLERGERLASYQRMLAEYRKLEATWSEKKRLAWKYLSISDKAVPGHLQQIPPRVKSDIEIADQILKHSKL
jgi:hypothetical protein